jgi:hypothetical protein
VEAKLASLVAFPSEVVIDRDAVGAVHARTQVLVFGRDADGDGEESEED